MEIISRIMPKDYDLIHGSDLHLGPACCFKEGIKDMVSYVKHTPNTFFSFTGDGADAVIPKDKRYAHSTMDREEWLMTPQQQAEKIIELFEPIKEQILLWQLGNHEDAVLNTYDITWDICKNLKVPWGGIVSKFVALHSNGRPMHKFFFTHGAGKLPDGAKDPIQRKANRESALKRKFEKTQHSDCIYMGCGHFHDSILVKPTVYDELLLTDDGKEIHQKPRFSVKQTEEYIPPECRWYASSAGFLKTYAPSGMRMTTYAEKFMYGPTRLGWIKLQIRNAELVNVEVVDATEFHKSIRS